MARGGMVGSNPTWGCSCPAPKEYPADRLLALLARASEVNVLDKGAHRDGMHHFEAWTSEDVYHVTYNPGGDGSGMCKHSVACAATMVGLGAVLEASVSWEADLATCEKAAKLVGKADLLLKGED